MFGLILGIILLIGGIITTIVLSTYTKKEYQKDRYGDKKRDDNGHYVYTTSHPYAKYSWIAVTGGIVLSCAFVLLGCIGSVSTGHTGIVTTFGRVENYTLDAGVHFLAPWNNITQMDNRVQKTTVTLPCFSADLQEVNTIYTVNYQISKTNAQDLYRTVGKEYLVTVVQPAITESVKTIMAHYTAEELIGKRDTLASEIEVYLGDQLMKYNIEVVSTAIEDMDFTDSFTNAVEAKQVAAQNKLKAEIEQEQQKKQAEADATVAKTKAEADAAVARTKAEADAEVAKIAAQADLEVQKINADAAEYAGQKEASKNKAIAESLTEELLDYYRAMQWDGKMPETMLGNGANVLYGLGE